MTPKQKKQYLLPLAVLFLFGIYDSVYIFNIEQPVLIGDSWRYVKRFLIPFYESGLSFATIYSDAHPSPITALVFIANAVVFDLSMKVELIIGIFARVLSTGLLLWLFLRHTDRKSGISAIGIIVTLSAIYPMAMYQWSVHAFTNVFILIAVVYFIRIDKVLNSSDLNENSGKKFLALTLFLVFMIAVARDYAYIAIVSSSTILFILFFTSKNRFFLYVGFTQLVFLWLGKVVYKYAGVREFGLVPDYAEKILANPMNIVNTFSLSMLSGAVPLEFINSVLGVSGTLFVAHFLVGLCMVLCVIYIRDGHWKRSSLPIFLVAFVVVFCVITITYRYLPEKRYAVWGGVPNRYIHIYSMGIVGLWWMVFEVTNSRKIWRIIGTAVLLMQIGFLFTNDVGAWKKIPARNAAGNKNSLLVYKQGMNEAPKEQLSVYGASYPKAQLSFLRDQSLSVFSQKLMTSEVKAYKQEVLGTE